VYFIGAQLEVGQNKTKHPFYSVVCDSAKIVMQPSLVDMPRGSLRVAVCSAGHHHSLLATQDGAAFSFGVGAAGQLGVGNLHTFFSPKRVQTLSNIVALAAGAQHSLWVDHQGTVY
jgi:alpha-tubulin suppressor-like RCC1 family protein